jgi:hypothetical protein
MTDKIQLPPESANGLYVGFSPIPDRMCAQCGQAVRVKRGLKGNLQPAAHRNQEYGFYCSGQQVIEQSDLSSR